MSDAVDDDDGQKQYSNRMIAGASALDQLSGGADASRAIDYIAEAS
jgi:hypothetical protein